MVMPFQYPENAMINFKPIADALDTYRQGMQVAGETTARINAANAMKNGDYNTAAAELAKVDPRAGMEMGLYPGKKEAQSMENQETTRKLVGGTMEALSAIPDQAQRIKVAQGIFSSDPKWAAGAAKFGYDINNPDHIDSIIKAGREEALGAQAPESKALTQARTAQALTEKVGPAESLVRIPTAGTPGTAPASGTAAVPPQGAQTLFKGGTTLQTQEERQAFADRNGILPGTEPYKQLMINGKIPDHDLPPREASMVDQNTKAIQASDVVLQKLKDAKRYSTDAYQGAFADARAAIVNHLPWVTTDSAKKAAEATTQMDILTKGQAMGQAKIDAGSRVTAYLEKIEQTLRANPNMSDSARQKVLDEAIQFIQQTRDMTYQQTQAILNRTAFKPGGAVNPPTTPQRGAAPSPGHIPTAEINEAYARARDAIANGKDPEAVKQRLRDNGIDPSGL